MKSIQMEISLISFKSDKKKKKTILSSTVIIIWMISHHFIDQVFIQRCMINTSILIWKLMFKSFAEVHWHSIDEIPFSRPTRIFAHRQMCACTMFFNSNIEFIQFSNFPIELSFQCIEVSGLSFVGRKDVNNQ